MRLTANLVVAGGKRANSGSNTVCAACTDRRVGAAAALTARGSIIALAERLLRFFKGFQLCLCSLPCTASANGWICFIAAQGDIA